ncbi:MAG TPA: hypothetical protein VIH99_08545 [Bdellovibrionota bacterium]|jgi:hypothetical protein
MRLHSVLFLILCLSAPAAQAARIAFVGAALSSEPQEPGTDYQGKPFYGYGVLMEFRFVPLFGLELGALSVGRKFEKAGDTGSKIAYSGKMYEFPALLRAHLGRTLSLGIGGYFAKVSGDITETTTTGSSSTTRVVSPATLNQTATDHGIVTSLALALRLAPLTYLLFDGRYTIGLKNNSTAAGGERKFNDSQLLAGLEFGF